MSNRKSIKPKPINKSINDEINNSAIQIKRLLSTIFPSTNDVYGFHLDEPSIESLNCYEQYAKMARDACLISSSTPFAPPLPPNRQHSYETSLASNRSVSSTSSFEM